MKQWSDAPPMIRSMLTSSIIDLPIHRRVSGCPAIEFGHDVLERRKSRWPVSDHRFPRSTFLPVQHFDEEPKRLAPANSMSSLKDVFRALIDMRDSGIITDYAIGGATAFLFYVEPTRTYDVDVFVRLPSVKTTELASLSALYEWAASRGIAVQGEHLMIESVPVQPLVAYNSLVEEAIDNARLHDYAGVPVRVVGPEHLIALALQAGGARRRERAWQLLQSDEVDRPRLRAILARHGVSAEIPDDV
jgi:hypothetical protein